jgi:predicted permease
LFQALVIGQVALSLTLLVGAGLFVRTLQRLEGMDTGFDRERVVVFNIDFTERVEDDRWVPLYRDLVARLEGLPGVRSASLFSHGYLSGNSWSDPMSAEGYEAAPGESLECVGTRAGSRFFETMGTRLLAGRALGPQDERSPGAGGTAPRQAAVINRALARRYFGEADPIGRHLFLVSDPRRRFEIVGVVADAKYGSLREEPRPAFYVPFFAEPRDRWANFALRTDADPRATIASLAAAVREVGRGLRVRDVRTMDDVAERSVKQERLAAELGGFFSLVALTLACLGLYGVLSFMVAQRARENGVRVALGAEARDVLTLVVGQGLKLTLIGAAAGLVGGLAVSRLVSGLLYGVSPGDPATFAGVVALLLAVAVLASWLPARRAALADPMVILRSE